MEKGMYIKVFMNSRYFLFYLLALFAILPSVSYAQAKKADLVSVSKVDFKKLQKNDIIRSNGQWIRVEIVLNAAVDAEKKTSNNALWIRNVSVTLSLMYEDAKDSKKGNREKIVMQETAKLFAIEANKETPVAFYIPPEAYSVYGITKAEPFAWSIELSVDGVKIPLSKDNYKSLLSRKILASGGNVTKVYDSYMKLVETSVKANKGVLIPVNRAPYQVQMYEVGKNANMPLPTYIVE